jgi:hypothetical protein
MNVASGKKDAGISGGQLVLAVSENSAGGPQCSGQGRAVLLLLQGSA